MCKNFWNILFKSCEKVCLKLFILKIDVKKCRFLSLFFVLSTLFYTTAFNLNLTKFFHFFTDSINTTTIYN